MSKQTQVRGGSDALVSQEQAERRKGSPNGGEKGPGSMRGRC